MTAYRIMVIDDERDLRDALCTALGDEGHVCVPMANGQEALDALRAGERPDVIILDLMMPTMDGWQFRAAQCADPMISELPVIVMTASRAANDVGAQAHLHKPLTLETLLTTIETVVEGQPNALSSSPIKM